MGILVVKIKQKTQNICIISGYGRQQNWPGDKRRSCFVALETEVETANLTVKAFIIELDASAKLENNYIAQTHMICLQMDLYLQPFWKDNN